MSFNSRILLGIFLILIGSLFIVDQLGLMDIDVGRSVVRFWPLLLMIWGLEIFSNRQTRSDVINAGLIVLLGVVFLGRNFGFFDFTWDTFWRLFWPLILILVGWSMLSGRRAVGRHHFAIMSSLEKQGPNWDVTDGSYLAFWGGVTLDLREAEIKDGVTVLDLTAIMGGVEVIAPENAAVHCRGTAILGAVEAFGRSQGGVFAVAGERRQGEGAKQIEIYARAIMGGVEVTRAPRSADIEEV